MVQVFVMLKFVLSGHVTCGDVDSLSLVEVTVDIAIGVFVVWVSLTYMQLTLLYSSTLLTATVHSITALCTLTSGFTLTQDGLNLNGCICRGWGVQAHAQVADFTKCAPKCALESQL